jgi:NADPH:quinone reductase-like Zn-dependent oxidoreductase
MRALIVDGAFGLGHLRVIETEAPSPGPTEVLVEVKAASLNYRDLMMVEGRYNPRQPLPLVPLSDGAGIVTAVGERVTTVKPGDRVCGLFSQDWIDGTPDKLALKSTLGGPLDGMARTHAVFRERGVAPIPDTMSFEEAACLPCAALTAWSAVIEEGRVRPGDVVLTLGSGGVSVFALQFAKAAGARVVVTTSSAAKAERLRALGADLVLERQKSPDWAKEARAFTAGRGVDLVVEVGGQGTLGSSIQALRPGGTIALIGVLADGESPTLTPVLMQHMRIQGIFVGHRRAFIDMTRAVVAHGIHPNIDRVFELDDAKSAFEHLRSGQHFGKVVLRIA